MDEPQSISLASDYAHVEKLLRAMREVAFDLIIELDSEDHPVYVSPSHEAVIGYSPDEIMAMPLLSLVHPDEVEALRIELQQMHAAGPPRRVTYRLRHRDGSYRFFEGVGTTYARASGDLHVLLTSRDISEQKAAEERLRASEERFQMLAAVSPVGIFQTDAHGICLYANERACEMSGQSVEEARTAGWTRYMHPKDRERVSAEQVQVAQEGSQFQSEFRFQHPDGTTTWVLAQAVPQQSERGEVVGYVGTLTDTTDLKAAEATARLQAAVVENMAEGVNLCRRSDRVIVYTNPTFERMFGYEPGELIDQRAIVLTLTAANEDDRQEAAERIVRAIQQAGIWRGELHYVKKDGTPLWCRACVSEFDHPEHGPVWLGVHEDITEQRKAKLALQRRQKLEGLGVLAGGIAHDFNNLLTGVLNHADLALARLDAGSSAQKPIQEVKMAARQMADLSNQMLAYSGRGHFAIEPVNLSGLVEEMARLLESSLSKKAALKYELAEELPDLMGDASQIAQLVMNLIINASEALGGERGVIRVNTGVIEADRELLSRTYLDDEPPPGQYVYLEVSDTGCGMDSEMLGGIFDPFFTTKATGRGLGMAAVLGIVRGHRGAIQIESEPGTGTTFLVLLPASTQRERARSPTASALEFRGPVPGARLLIVDDESIVRDSTRALLEKAGFRVLTAEDGLAAVEILRDPAEEIDLVLLDLSMPHWNGPEALRQFRRIRPDLRAILCSGYPEHEAQEEFAGDGIVGFIQKPYDMALLIDKICTALERGG